MHHSKSYHRVNLPIKNATVKSGFLLRVDYIPFAHAKKLLIRLDLLNRMKEVSELPPNLNCHQLKGDKQNLFSITVTGNWRLTFEFNDGDVYIVNYEDYH